jgi:hypothetical protein
MATNKQATLLTVYERVIGNPSIKELNPTFTVSQDTVNVYFSNKATNASSAPANKTEMVLDDASPYSAGVYGVKGITDYVLFEAASGTPVIKTKDLIK